MTKQIIIIGRGHSGTRLIMETLAKSGVFVGKTNGKYYDHVPPFQMYAAVSLFGFEVEYFDNLEWNFNHVRYSGETVDLYRLMVREYLREFKEHNQFAWKLPESVLALPWLVNLYPDAYYIHWVRDARDCILVEHQTDYLQSFNVPVDEYETRLENAAVSWRYIHELIDYTEKPDNWITIRFEDFVLEQDQTLLELQAFLGMNLTKLPVIRDRVGRWVRWHEHDYKPFHFDALMPIIEKHLRQYRYD